MILGVLPMDGQQQGIWDLFRESKLQVVGAHLKPDTTSFEGGKWGTSVELAVKTSDGSVRSLNCPYTYVGKGAHRDVVIAELSMTWSLDMQGVLPADRPIRIAAKVCDPNDKMSEQDYSFLCQCSRIPSLAPFFPTPLVWVPSDRVLGNLSQRDVSLVVTQAMNAGENLSATLQRLEHERKPREAFRTAVLAMDFAIRMQQLAVESAMGSFLGEMHSLNVGLTDESTEDKRRRNL